MRRIVEKIKKQCTTKKCRMCGIPLNGWRYKLIVRPLCRITPDSPDICCKCAEEKEKNQ